VAWLQRMDWPDYDQGDVASAKYNPRSIGRMRRRCGSPVPRSEFVRIFLASSLRLKLEQIGAGQQCGLSAWRVGGQGGITANEIILIGLIQVNQESWQPILQLERHIS
jgi:hypothetical protein